MPARDEKLFLRAFGLLLTLNEVFNIPNWLAIHMPEQIQLGGME